jgi:DNA-binding IclR family transcriptional regulator
LKLLAAWRESALSQPKQTSDSGIQSVQRAAAILRSFTKTDSELGVTTLSEQLGLHKSTISRLLATLEQEGFVEKNPDTGKYHLGLGLVTLAGIVLDHINLRQVAQPHLNTLVEQTQETVNLVVLSGTECMNIEGADSPRPVQYVGRIGRRTPLHCTAAGKVLLAHLNAEARQPILAGPLARFTDKTIIDRSLLEQHLTDICRRGYAVAHEEHQEGVSAVAAPIYDHRGKIMAAVTVSGPTYRLEPDQIETCVEPVLATARNISTHVGYNGA